MLRFLIATPLVLALLALMADNQQLPPQKGPDLAYHGCQIRSSSYNVGGYQNVSWTYDCAEGRVTLSGKWTERIDTGWDIRKDMGVQVWPYEYYVGWERPKWGKWCDAPRGYELCGEN